MSARASEPDHGHHGDDAWRGVAEQSPVSMCVVGLDGVLSLANEAFASMLGYSCDELQGMRLHDLTHPDDQAADQDLLDEALRGERSTFRIAGRYLHAGGHVVRGDVSVRLVRSPGGDPLHVIEVLDVGTDRRDHEPGWSDSVLDTVDVGLVRLDADGVYQRVNRQQRDILALGYPAGHLGRAGQCGDVFAVDGVTVLLPEEIPCARAARGEEFDDQRIWVGAQPGNRRALAVSARTVHDERGESDGAALAYSDVTDLLDALRAREVFVASVSHELRTPLTVVLGHLEMLLDQDGLPDDVARHLQVVARSAVRLRTLVSDLLDPATAATGDDAREVSLDCTTTDLAGLVVEVVESVLPTALAARVVLAVRTRGPARVVLDPHRVRQVVENLVGNAVKYTDEGGRVDVLLQVEDGQAVLSVVDTGIGIEAADVAQLFTPFFRADPARRRVSPGLGLGLGIARSIVLAHTGRLEVHSEPGRGSTFVVTLPVGGPGGPTSPP